MRIGRRIERLRIDAAQDAAEPVTVSPQQRRQVPAVVVRQQLPRVGRADRGDQIGVADAAGERAVRRVRFRRRQAVLPYEVLIDWTGEAEVVDGADARRAGPRMPAVAGEAGGDEAGVPIVQVQNVRLPVRLAGLSRPEDAGSSSEHAVAEGEKARGIVVVAVDLLPVECCRLLEQVDGHACDVRAPECPAVRQSGDFRRLRPVNGSVER